MRFWWLQLDAKPNVSEGSIASFLTQAVHVRSTSTTGPETLASPPTFPPRARPDWWRLPGCRRILAAMPEHGPTRTDRMAVYMRARVAKRAVHDETVRVVEC